MGVTVTGITELSAALNASPELLQMNLRKAVQVTCTKVKADARARVRGHKYWPLYPNTITYDTKVTPVSVEGEIGPDRSMKKQQASYGAIIEFGTSRTPPIPHLGPALDANADDLLHGVEIAVAQAL